MSDLLLSTIQCIDASLRAAPEMADTGDEPFYSQIDELIKELKDKYEINGLISDSPLWEGPADDIRKDVDALDVKIMLLVWEHITTLMTDCGAGDIVREVLASELLGVQTSWDRKKAEAPKSE